MKPAFPRAFAMPAGSLVTASLACLTLAIPFTVSAATREATDTTSFRIALNAAQNGDRIHLQAGSYVGPAGGWHIKRSIELFGDGPGEKQGSATVLKPASNSDPVLVLDLAETPAKGVLENIYIHDLQVRQDKRPESPSDRSDGITWLGSGLERNLLDLRLARLYIANMGNDGIHLVGTPSPPTYTVAVSVTDVDVEDCVGHGINMYQGMAVYCLGGYYHRNGLSGGFFAGCPAIRIIGAVFEANDGRGLGKPQLQLDSCHGFLVEGGHFEEFNNGGSGAVRIDGAMGGYIGSCMFVNARGRGSRGIWVSDAGTAPPSPTSGVVIGPNFWSNTDVLIEIANSDSVRSCVVQPQAVYNAAGVAAKMIIPESADRGHIVYPGTGNTTNLTAGIEFPRLSASKRDAMSSPTSGGTRREGLVVYNDSRKELSYWDASRWRENVAYFPLTSAANAPPGGVILPAITTAQANAIPAAFKVQGALIFNIDSTASGSVQYWDIASASWKDVGSR
jgi:hypothetical protein